MKQLEEFLYQRQVNEAARMFIANNKKPITVKMIDRGSIGNHGLLEDLEEAVQQIVNERLESVLKVAMQRLEKKEKQLLLTAKAELLDAVKTIEACEAEGLKALPTKEETNG